MDGDGDFFGEFAAGLDPDVWAWLPGVDYAAGWREARAAADDLNACLAACGVQRSELRAVADTDARGGGLVRLVGGAAGWLKVEELLTRAVEEARRGAA